MADKCDNCEIKFKQNEAQLHCSGQCSKCFHPKCVNLTNKDVQFINNLSNLKWFCNECLQNFSNTIDVKKEIADLKTNVIADIKLIKEKIQSTEMKMHDQSVTKKTYADSVGEIMVIKPKNCQESEKTKSDLKGKLNPTNLEIGIKQIRSVKDGGVLIKCNNMEDIERLKRETQKKLQKGYVVKTYSKKSPRLKIVGFEDELNSDELMECLFKQNACINKTTAKIETKIIKKMKNLFMAIVECDPSTFKSILDQGKVNIGWSVCRVFEHVQVLRCFKCGGFNHIAATCKSDITCKMCASSSHSTADCDALEHKCANCIQIKSTANIEVDINHSMFDINCPSYQRQVNFEKRNINYVPASA